MGPYQVLAVRFRVDQGVMVIKGQSTFLKATGLEPHHQIVLCHIQDTRWMVEFYRSAEMQSVYSPSPTDWARIDYLRLLRDFHHLYANQILLL